MYITDLQHFLDSRGAIRPNKGSARAMAQFQTDVVALATNTNGLAPHAPNCVKCKRRGAGHISPRRRRSLEVPTLRDGRPHLELAGHAVGPARPARATGLIGVQPMGLSSRLLLLTADDVLHRLAEADFARLCQDKRAWHLPVFASQRIRWVSLVVELFDRQPIRVRAPQPWIPGSDDSGRLDVNRMNRQQVARPDAAIAPVLTPKSNDTVIDASSRFAARGGLWKPNADVSARLNAAALSRLSCPRIKLEPWPASPPRA